MMVTANRQQDHVDCFCFVPCKDELAQEDWKPLTLSYKSPKQAGAQTI